MYRCTLMTLPTTAALRTPIARHDRHAMQLDGTVKLTRLWLDGDQSGRIVPHIADLARYREGTRNERITNHFRPEAVLTRPGNSCLIALTVLPLAATCHTGPTVPL